uniref:Uncharacterized protein n=1 Tax=Aegilops tauschii subsp. strangulata TaxID=200361 RepID=A0A453RWW2_AEGTS
MRSCDKRGGATEQEKMAEKMFKHGVAGGAAEVQVRRGGQSKRGSGEMPAEQESSWAVEQERFMGGALVAGRPSLLCLTEDRRGNIFWWVRRPRARFAVICPPPPILSGLLRILLNLGRAIPMP